jgi:hypothetical protein
MRQGVISSTLLLLATHVHVSAFTIPQNAQAHFIRNTQKLSITRLGAESDVSDEPRSISAKSLEQETIEIKSSTPSSPTQQIDSAKTNTVNERLMAELQAATDAENGPKTRMGEKFKGAFKYTDKSDAERQAALEAAKDLNGVNPIVTILASFFAFGMAFGLWTLTQFFAEAFVTHPVPADAPYAFVRAAGVFRNAVMGLTSLASGFSLVSGLGVFLLGCRVAFGVFTGELDPTPIKKPGLKNDDIDIPNVWDLMTNKKPNKRGRR